MEIAQSQTTELHEELALEQDFLDESVPIAERRSPLTMGLLWITMVTGFPSVLIGFEWFRQNLALPQIIVCLVVSNLVLLAYAMPACYLGAHTGQTFSLISRYVFGRWGARFMSVNLIWLSMGWYGLTAFLMADAIRGLYHLPVDVGWLAFGFGIIMAFNNFFGFNGIANFAGYLAAPVLVLWVVYTFIKAVVVCPAQVLVEPSHHSFAWALPIVSSFIVGYGAWGNEPDFWRYGKIRKSYILIPLIVANGIGQFVFPITGWMLAKMSGVTEFGAATAFMNQYSFGGLAWVAALVLFVTYFALADSCLYGSINGVVNLKQLPRRLVVAVLTVLGALLAAWFSRLDKAFEDVASLSSIILPCATCVMLADAYILPRLKKTKNPLLTVYSLAQVEQMRWTAVLAVVAGSTIGVLTAGIIPGLAGWHVGVSALQGWGSALVIYLLLEYLIYMRNRR